MSARFPHLKLFLLFTLALLLALQRGKPDPFLWDEDMGEGKVSVRFLSFCQEEEGGVLCRCEITGGDFPELYGKKAYLRVYGASHFYHPWRVEGWMKVRVKEGRVWMTAYVGDLEPYYGPMPLRERLLQRLEEKIKDPSVRSLVATFFMGEDMSLLPLRVQYYYTATGLVHLLVVSGGHLGILFLLTRHLLPYRYGLVLSAVVISAYTLLLVPQEPPVLRAYFMILFYIILRLLYERPDIFGLLLFSGVVLLVLFPQMVYSYSFWLSFCGTAFLILSFRNISFPEGVKGWWISSFWASFFAFLGVSPILALFTHITPLTVILTPLLTPIVLPFSFYGFVDLFTGFSLPSLPLEFLAKVMNITVAYASTVAPELEWEVSFYSVVVTEVVGMLILYLTKGYRKLLVLPLFLIASFL